MRFCIKLVRFVTNNFFFISKRASLVQNRPRNHANVNDPLFREIFQQNNFQPIKDVKMAPQQWTKRHLPRYTDWWNAQHG
jgi:hypothetical protein